MTNIGFLLTKHDFSIISKNVFYPYSRYKYSVEDSWMD